MGALTKKKEEWRGQIPYVGANNDSPSPKITAKALWLLGEMGLLYPEETTPYAEKIASFLDSPEDLLRERALNALGRIGRAQFETVKPYLEELQWLAENDTNPVVRIHCAGAIRGI